MQAKQTLLTQALKYENLSASALAKLTGLSQPTVSRTLQKMPVRKLGAGRNTVFALLASETPIPLYQVSANGRILPLAELYLQPEGRSLLIFPSGQYQTYEGLPFFIYDTLPTGFLGNIHLKSITPKDPQLTHKSQDWSDTQILHYLTHYGHDLAGNLIFGTAMAEAAAQSSSASIQRSSYPELVNNLQHSPNPLGSSIAGEQPKFTVFNEHHHLIVKYSPPFSANNPVAVRHQDLLVCEHLALQTLNAHNIPATQSTLHQDDRFYLELVRFDRIGQQGRKGIVSLKYLDAEFTGLNGDWIEIAKALHHQTLIDDHARFLTEVAYTFGKYIANSDMHNGNFSFFLDEINLTQPTPIYDMLPMAYMPVQGELRNPDFTPPRFINVSIQAQNLAKKMAIHFWQQVEQSPLISSEMKNLLTQQAIRAKIQAF